jgi:hypothetical protein
MARRFGIDLLERVSSTLALTGVAGWVADERLISITQEQGWRFALFVAFLSLVKGIVARLVFERDSASLAPLEARATPRASDPLDERDRSPDEPTRYDY